MLLLSSVMFKHDSIGVAHDHMGGSGHCVECSGPCNISDPTQAAYTCLIRSLFESEQYNGKMPYMAERCLIEHGINVESFRAKREK